MTAHSRTDHVCVAGQPRSTLSLEYTALAPKCTHHQHTVSECVALASEVYAAFAPVVEFRPHTPVAYAAPAHVVDHIALAPTVYTAQVYVTPAHVDEYIALEYAGLACRRACCGSVVLIVAATKYM